MFDPRSFDLPAYLARIGYEGDAKPDLDTLRAIALKHPIALPFENLNPFFGRPVPLDIASLQRKMLQEGRGGYCFEHNLLLGTALSAIGFEVVGLAARVMWTNPPDVTTPRSHMLLLMRVGRERYIADAGFGGLTLTAPLVLAPGLEQQTPHERVRLVPDGETLIVQASVRNEWKALYRFDLHPQALADYEVTNWYLSHNPASHFVTSLVAARTEPDRRHGLRNAELVTHYSTGTTDRRVLLDPRDLRDALTQVFDIRIPDDMPLDDAFARFMPAAMRT